MKKRKCNIVFILLSILAVVIGFFVIIRESVSMKDSTSLEMMPQIFCETWKVADVAADGLKYLSDHSSDTTSKVVWEETISSDGETYRVSFERISAVYDAESILYRYCADYQLIVRDSDGKDISKQTIANFPVWYEEVHWLADVSGDGFSDVVLCSFYEITTLSTDLYFYIWDMDKREYEEQPLPWHLWRPVWNEKLSCVIFTDESYDDIRMKMVSFENGEWILRGELLPGEIMKETEEAVQIQCKEIFYTEEGNIENKIIVNIPEQNMPWNDVNSIWCDDNSQNEYLNPGSLDWDIIDVELEAGKSSPKYVRKKTVMWKKQI